MSQENPRPVRKVLIIVSRGSLDGIYPALILANGARMEGIEASLFFTFFGLSKAECGGGWAVKAKKKPPPLTFDDVVKDTASTAAATAPAA